MDLTHRPRRLRQFESLRRMTQETHLNLAQIVYPVFVKESGVEEISAMPGVARRGLSELVDHLGPMYEKGLRSFAIFPVISPKLKDAKGSAALDLEGLAPRTLRKLRETFSESILFADVALDPYTDHGHDGLLEGGRILNDETVEVLAKQALVLASAGAHFVSPSDMMDGRVGFIRQALDEESFGDVGILSYCAKYASSFYGPFREALGSAPKGDKKTYQMNPANRREALRELELDLSEGADMVMVKPAGMYLDIISDFKARSPVPVAAYQVSGEYSMIKAAGLNGWLDGDRAFKESLLSIRRAGADLIFTYFAPECVKWLRE